MAGKPFQYVNCNQPLTGRLSFLPSLGWKNEHHLSGWVLLMAMVNVNTVF